MPNISIFGTNEHKTNNLNNIKLSINYITHFIRNWSLKNDREEDISCLEGFEQAAFSLISAIYKSSWNMLQIRENNKTFCIKMKKQFIKQVSSHINNKKKGNSLMPKLINSLNLFLPHPIPPRLSKENLNKLKFH